MCLLFGREVIDTTMQSRLIFILLFNLKFGFNETSNLTSMGVCVSPNHIVPGMEGRIVKPGNLTQSLLYYRVTTNDPFYRMPFLGRTIVHDEGVALIAEWINSITECPN